MLVPPHILSPHASDDEEHVERDEATMNEEARERARERARRRRQAARFGTLVDPNPNVEEEDDDDEDEEEEEQQQQPQAADQGNNQAAPSANGGASNKPPPMAWRQLSMVSTSSPLPGGKSTDLSPLVSPMISPPSRPNVAKLKTPPDLDTNVFQDNLSTTSDSPRLHATDSPVPRGSIGSSSSSAFDEFPRPLGFQAADSDEDDGENDDNVDAIDDSVGLVVDTSELLRQTDRLHSSKVIGDEEYDHVLSLIQNGDPVAAQKVVAKCVRTYNKLKKKQAPNATDDVTVKRMPGPSKSSRQLFARHSTAAIPTRAPPTKLSALPAIGESSGTTIGLSIAEVPEGRDASPRLLSPMLRSESARSPTPREPSPTQDSTASDPPYRLSPPGADAAAPTARTGRRATISLTSMSASDRQSMQSLQLNHSSSTGNPGSPMLGDVPKPSASEDEELRLIGSTSLILQRLQLESSLSGQLRQHINLALGYLDRAHQRCQLRAANIEKRMAKRLSMGSVVGSGGNDAVAQFIAQEYMQNQRSSSSSTSKTKRKKKRRSRRETSTEDEGDKDESAAAAAPPSASARKIPTHMQEWNRLTLKPGTELHSFFQGNAPSEAEEEPKVDEAVYRSGTPTREVVVDGAGGVGAGGDAAKRDVTPTRRRRRNRRSRRGRRRRKKKEKQEEEEVVEQQEQEQPQQEQPKQEQPQEKPQEQAPKKRRRGRRGGRNRRRRKNSTASSTTQDDAPTTTTTTTTTQDDAPTTTTNQDEPTTKTKKRRRRGRRGGRNRRSRRSTTTDSSDTTSVTAATIELTPAASPTKPQKMTRRGTVKLRSAKPRSPKVQTEPHPIPSWEEEEQRSLRRTEDSSEDLSISQRPRQPALSESKSKRVAIAKASPRWTILRRLIADPEVQEALELSEEWEFDVWRLDELAQGHTLTLLAMHVLHISGLISRLSLSRSRLVNFFTEVERRYNTVPYHNHVHAADVMQATYFYLLSSLLRGCLSPQEMLAALIAAAVHDVDHPGTTNAFQVASDSPLAVLYNDQSVLENHHAATAFRLLARPDCNVLDSFSRPERMEMREVIIAMVLATDMKTHVHHMAEIESTVESLRSEGRWFGAPETDDSEAPSQLTQEHNVKLLKMALHCADLGNPCRPRYLCCEWTERVCEEFFRQGDLERELGLPVTPMMDRRAANIPKSQVGFIRFVVQPLFVIWADVLPEVDVCKTHLAANLEYWETLVAKQSKEDKQKEVSE